MVGLLIGLQVRLPCQQQTRRLWRVGCSVTLANAVVSPIAPPLHLPTHPKMHQHTQHPTQTRTHTCAHARAHTHAHTHAHTNTRRLPWRSEPYLLQLHLPTHHLARTSAEHHKSLRSARASNPVPAKPSAPTERPHPPHTMDPAAPARISVGSDTPSAHVRQERESNISVPMSSSASGMDAGTYPFSHSGPEKRADTCSPNRDRSSRGVGGCAVEGEGGGVLQSGHALQHSSHPQHIQQVCHILVTGS